MRLRDLNLSEWGSRLKTGTLRAGAQKNTATLLVVALLGLLCAFLLNLLVEGSLLGRTLEAEEALARVVAKRTPSVLNRMNQQKNAVLADQPNAFGVADRTPSGNAAGAGDAALSSMMLVGTLPNVAAWIRTAEETSLVLKGQLYRGYVLELVDSGRILVSKDGNNSPLYLFLSGASKPADAPDTSTNGASPNSSGGGQIQPAVVGGAEGVISRELINKLMTNPYDEMGKIRMVPDPSGAGMKILRIAPDSLLGQLGMQEGDTLGGFNGISIVNMGNLSNAIGSLMGGSRMDLQLRRNSEDVVLPYAVR